MKTIGSLITTAACAPFDTKQIRSLVADIRQPLFIVYDQEQKRLGLVQKGTIQAGDVQTEGTSKDLIGIIPALYPEWLGDRSFQERHHVRFAYVGGAMARGIASADMVIELATCSMLGFFGAAGLSLSKLETELIKIKSVLDPQNLSWGSNLIHTPDDLALEKRTVELYLQLGVKRLSAAAFMTITPSLVLYACKGLKQNSAGQINREQYIFAKISRPEVASQFLEPAPEPILKELIKSGELTAQEASLARQIPLAEDLTVEADSGGHTDNRPLNVLFPLIAMEREKVIARYQYVAPIRLGAAGGISTPTAVAGAFAMGAAYVLVGTVHQACMESGLSTAGKKMLSQADMTDVIMTPSADMFELSGKVQVLKKGSMMGVRGNQLYQLYLQYDSIEAIPVKIRHQVEKSIFAMALDEVWEKTKSYFANIDAGQIVKAEKEPKHKMALIFRWYLGNSSHWAITGDQQRQLDFQIWCGPAIGAFNHWCQGTFLENWENRKIQQVALNLMEGAAMITKAQQLRTYGVAVAADLFQYKPIPLGLD